MINSRVQLTLSQGDSPARTYQSPAGRQALTATVAGYGVKWSDWLARLDPVTSSWRTSQTCLLAQVKNEADGLAEFLGTWPRSGLMLNDIAFRLPPLAHIRDRVWIIAYPGKERGQRICKEQIQRQPAFSWCEDVRRAEDLPERSHLYPSKLCGSGDGIPQGVDRLGGVGNAVVPHIPMIIGQTIMAVEGRK